MSLWSLWCNYDATVFTVVPLCLLWFRWGVSLWCHCGGHCDVTAVCCGLQRLECANVETLWLLSRDGADLKAESQTAYLMPRLCHFIAIG